MEIVVHHKISDLYKTLGFTEMRVTILLILTSFSLTTFGQGVTGKYQNYFGHYLEFNKNLTFRYDYKFDLIHDWATGRWTVSDDIIILEFIAIYDTLTRPNKADSLVLSIDEISNRINEEEFAISKLTSGGQHIEESFKLVQKRKRLFPIDKKGEIIRTRRRGIWPQKKWPWGYKTWPPYYFKES
jgi:hypothetical protein